MRQPEVYEPVGQTLALYCQSDRKLLPVVELDYAWFPAELNDLGYSGWGRCTVEAESAHIAFGGGSHHFGYDLELDRSASAPRVNAWQLFMYSNSSRWHLTTMHLPKDTRLSSDELLNRAIEGYERRLSNHPETEGAWISKILLMLRFGKCDRAEAACNDWVTRRPKYWLPRFIHAHVRARLGFVNAAATEINAWAESENSFANYVYVFLYNMREDRDDAALDAIRKALGAPFVHPPGSGTYEFGLAYDAAVFAFVSEDYQLCLALCNKVLDDSYRDHTWSEDICLRNFLKLEAAVRILLNQKAEACSVVERIRDSAALGTSTGDEHRHRAFLDAIQDEHKSLLRDYRNWQDELRDWYSPVETQEKILQGPNGASLLYPRDWRNRIYNTVR